MSDDAAKNASRGVMRGAVVWLGTALLAAAALWAVYALYEREMSAPWTRDGQVQADLVLMASPVDGVIEDVFVHSGSEVREGEALFTVRPHRPVPAGLAPRSPERYAGSAAVYVQRADGLLEVRSPALGWVVQSTLHRGSAVNAGQALFALAVRDSFRVTGFFRETLLRRIREGARARVTLMAWPDKVLYGVVENVGRGIARSDGELDAELLPRVTPTFDWIRLAQRFPVRVKLDSLPPDIELRVGLTASVQILE